MARAHVRHDAAGRPMTSGRVRLQRYRAERPGLTIAELANACRVSKSALGELLSGATRVPSLPVANALKRVLGIPTEAWEHESISARPDALDRMVSVSTARGPRAA